MAHVTSLLLRMEEVGRRLQEPSSPVQSTGSPSSSAEKDAVTEDTGDTEQSPESSHSSSHSSQKAESSDEWSFSFEQVLASLLNEPAIVGFFEKPFDIQAKLGQAKVAQLKLKVKK